MKNLTELDKKILFELDKDGVASFSEIAETLGTTPQVVKYHYENFLDRGIIKNFWAFVDYDKAGYPIFWGYWLKFQGTTKEQEDEVFAFLQASFDFPIVMRSDGYADAFVALIAPDVFTHNSVLQDFLAKFGENVIVSDMVIGLSFKKFPRSYLIDQENTLKDFSLSGGTTERVKITSMDRRIISVLQVNGRTKLSSIAEKINVSRSFIYKHYQKLIKTKVITKTAFTFNHEKIGMKMYRNLFKVNESNKTKMEAFENYCAQHPNIINYVRTMGPWQAMIDFEVKDSAHLRTIIRDIRHDFSEIIKEIATNEIYKIDKFAQMKIEYPELAEKFGKL